MHNSSFYVSAKIQICFVFCNIFINSRYIYEYKDEISMIISLITATYNSGSTIEDTLKSVLAQTYNDIDYRTVSNTHLTLPTNSLVKISVVAVS